MSTDVTLEAVDNKEDWDDTIELFDGDDPYDLTDATAMTIKVWLDSESSEVLSGTLGGALTIADAPNGIVSIHFDASSMDVLCAKQYNWSLRAVIDGATKTLILGKLPILDGGP